MKKGLISEAKIQKKGMGIFRQKGWTAIRLILTGEGGMPATVFLKQNREPVFVEFKKSIGGVLSALQRYKIKLLKSRGFEAYASASPTIHLCDKEIICHTQCDKCKLKPDQIDHN